MRIDEIASIAQVMQSLAQTFPGKRFAAADVCAFLDELVDLDMALTDGNDHYLGLALMPTSLRPELEAASRRASSVRRTVPIVATAGRGAAEPSHA